MVRQLMDLVPASTYRIVTDRFGDEMEQTDDYYIDWEFEVVPVNLSSCSVSLFLSMTSALYPTWGMGFDRQDRIRQRFGLGQLVRANTWGFGHEPVHMTNEELRGCVLAVLRGEVLLRYRAAFGFLWATSGAVSLDGHWQRPFGAPPLLGSKVYRYAPWHQGVTPTSSL